MDPPLNLGLIVNSIEANHALEENVKLGVTLGVLRHLKERTEDVWMSIVSSCFEGNKREVDVLTTMSSYVLTDPLAL